MLLFAFNIIKKEANPNSVDNIVDCGVNVKYTCMRNVNESKEYLDSLFKLLSKQFQLIAANANKE